MGSVRKRKEGKSTHGPNHNLLLRNSSSSDEIEDEKPDLDTEEPVNDENVDESARKNEHEDAHVESGRGCCIHDREFKVNPPKQNKNRKGFINWKKRLQDSDKPCSKEEYAVAKHLRFNVATKDAKFIPLGTIVKTFVASKVVDALLESKWAKSGKGDIQFTDRKSCVAFCDKLLMKGLFHRALKVDRPKKKKRKLEDTGAEEEKKSKKDKKSKKEKLKEKETEKVQEGDKSEDKKDEKKDEEKKKDDEKKKKEKKIHIDMHDDQRFVDGDELYVWIYDPVPAKTFIIGLLMVIGAAALCVFPLWPDELRVGVYYCSLVGASFVGFILVLVIVRFILFCILWLVTFGKLHFWLLPNLTEDVGFFDSFRPVYKYNVCTGNEKQEKEEKKRLKREKRQKELEEERGSPEEEEENQEPEFEMVQPEDVEEETEDKNRTEENLEDVEVDEDEEYENEDDDEEDTSKFDDEEEDSTNGNDTETKKKK